MVAGGLPTIQALLDAGAGTFPYDVTSYVRLVDGIKVSRGRDDEQSDVTAGQCTLVLDNSDGRFTLGSTIIASPSPITIDNQLRVKYTANATAFNRHTGYLISEPVAWPTGGDLESRVSVTCVDAQARAERWPLLSTWLANEILATNPTSYWSLADSIGSTTAADINGAFPMSKGAAAPTFGSTVLPGTSDSTGASFTPGQTLGVRVFSGGTSNAGYLVAFSTSSVSVGIAVFNVSSGLSVSLDASGKLNGAGPLNDGLPHTVGIRVAAGAARVYVDGVDTGAVAGTDDGNITLGLDNSGTGFTGVMAHAAYWSTAPTAAQMLSMTKAFSSSGYASETTTQRITRLAGYANVPIGTIDSSSTLVATQDTNGTSAWTAIQNTADSEVGVAFINGTGTLDSHNRNRAVSKTTPDATVDAEFLAEDTAFAVDTQGVINYFETTSSATGAATQVVRNATSELGDGTVTHPGHGRYPGSASYLVTTDAEALDRANWIVANHAEPQPRAGTLTLDLLTMTAAQQAACLALEPDSWLRITNLPSQTPGGTTGDFVVEGLADTLTLTSWTLALNVVSRSLFSPVWILGDSTYSVLGSTTRLYI